MPWRKCGCSGLGWERRMLVGSGDQVSTRQKVMIRGWGSGKRKLRDALLVWEEEVEDLRVTWRQLVGCGGSESTQTSKRAAEDQSHNNKKIKSWRINKQLTACCQQEALKSFSLPLTAASFAVSCLLSATRVSISHLWLLFSVLPDPNERLVLELRPEAVTGVREQNFRSTSSRSSSRSSSSSSLMAIGSRSVRRC